MKALITHKEYAVANIRLEELISIMDEKGLDASEEKEFEAVGSIIEKYEEIHFPIGIPSLIELIELRMFEMNLKRKDLAKLLNTSGSRISDYLTGKREITLSVAKSLHQKLNIDSDIILQK
ncbi:MAG: transcriptional regulator [Flavobacteriales bacterium]|nr:MAG: transcriptional regulator [Flavobacteriales bacterium]